MKIFNDRYRLIKKIRSNNKVSEYKTKDLFKNQYILSKVYEKNKITSQIENSYKKIKQLIHPHLLKYYNFENTWMVDSKISQVNYYIIAYENVEKYFFKALKNNEINVDITIKIINQLLNLIFYLYKNGLYFYDFKQYFVRISGELSLKLDLLNCEIYNKFDKNKFNSLIDKIAEVFDKNIKTDNSKVKKLLEILKKNQFENSIKLIDFLKEKNLYDLCKYDYLYLKENWTARDIGETLHLDILKDIYQFQIKRNSKICFLFRGQENSIKTILIEDFLNYIKSQNYLKLEIVMQNFHDFLKYLFDCIKHYELNPDLNKKIDNLFQQYYETMDDNYLLQLQDNLIKLLFNFSLTRKVVIHIKNIIRINDRIIKFINLMLHISIDANIVLIFDAVLEKTRFDVFYKNPKFEIITKEYNSLDKKSLKNVIQNILCEECNNEEIINILQKYEINNVFSIINFLSKIYKNNLLIIDLENKKIELKKEKIEENKKILLKDDLINKCMNYLREPEKDILWYLANSRSSLTLNDFVEIMDSDKNSLLEYFGTLRIHAYIEEIWEEEDNPYYKIVNEDFKNFFKNLKGDKVKKLRRNLIKFLNKQKGSPSMLVDLIKLLYQEKYYYTAIEYIFYILKNFVLTNNDYKELLKYVIKLLNYPRTIFLKWHIKWSHLNILKMLDKKKELKKYLDKYSQDAINNFEKIDNVEVWYALIYYYENYYDDKAASKKIDKIYGLLKTEKSQINNNYLNSFIKFILNKKDNKSLIDNLLKKDNTKLPLNIEMNIKYFIVKFLFNEGDYNRIEENKDMLIDYFEKNDTGDYDVGKIIKAFYLRMGNFELDEGDAKKAYNYYKKSLEYAAKNKDHRYMIKLHNNLAAAKYFMAVNDIEIIKELQKAVSIGKQIGEYENIVVALANLSDLHSMNFYYKQANEYIKKALKYSSADENSVSYFIVLSQYIWLLINLGDFDKAEKVKKEYKELTEKSNSWYDIVSNHSISGKIFYYKKEYEKSIEYFDKFTEELEKHNLYNYDYVNSLLFKVDIFLEEGKKTKAKRTFNKIKDIVAEHKIDLGDIELNVYEVYFLENLQEKIDKLEEILNENKKNKKNQNVLKILLDLSKCYEEKEFRYRLYEIYSEILFFEQQIKNNFPKEYIKSYQKNYFLEKINERKKILATHIELPLKEIKFKNIKEKWEKYYKNNVHKFFDINMKKLINNWNYSISKSNKIKKQVLKFILNISNADRAAFFVKDNKNTFVLDEVILKHDVYQEDEFNYSLINSKIKEVNNIFVKEYNDFSTEIVKAGVYPLMHPFFSGVTENDDNNNNEIYEYFDALIYLDSKSYCNFINKSLNEYIFPVIQYLNLLYYYEEVQEEIIRCPLTNLLSRSYFLKELEDSIGKRKRNKTIGLLLLDIDKMNQINSEFGSEIGDKILQKIAKILNSNISSYDIIGRYMGDEFVISYQNISKTDLHNKGEQILNSISKNDFLKKYNVSVSIGLSFIPDHGEKVDIVISKAIAAMTVAKKRKNRLVLWEDEYGLYRGKHDILAGVINKDFSSTEKIIRNLIELIIIEKNNLTEYGKEIKDILKRLLNYDYLYFYINVNNNEYIYKNKEFEIVEDSLKESINNNDSVINVEWIKNGNEKSYSSIARRNVYEAGNIKHEIYMMIPMDEYEYNHNDANMINIINKIIRGQLFYISFKEKNRKSD